MSVSLAFTLNGRPREVTTDARRSLLEILREDLQFTGTKYGCGEGQCRACTVLLDGQPVPSCLTPASTAAGRSVETIEGLASDQALHPVQQAFIDEDAMQCGYCVPGMILSTVALLRKNPRPTDQELIDGLDGNLCRCCGYPNLLKAARNAARRAGQAAAQADGKAAIR